MMADPKPVALKHTVIQKEVWEKSLKITVAGKPARKHSDPVEFLSCGERISG